MLTIPEIAIKIVNETLSESNADTARTVLFAGNKSVGKTSLVNTLLEKTNEIQRETLALEYTYGRKSRQRHSIEKVLCHIWEYGGKLELLHEVISVIPRTNYHTFFITLDLSKPKKIWNVLESSLDVFKSAYFLPGKPNTNKSNLVIIGGKYDIFKNYETDAKKAICTTLRSVALLQETHLFFYSSKEPALAKKLREILHFFAFGSNNLPSEKVYSYNKPLCIVSGLDSWESIGVPEQTFETIKTKHLAKFPPDIEDSVGQSAAIRSAHAEPILDALKTKKYEDMLTLDGMDLSINDYLRSLR